MANGTTRAFCVRQRAKAVCALDSVLVVLSLRCHMYVCIVFHLSASCAYILLSLPKLGCEICATLPRAITLAPNNELSCPGN